MFNVYFAGDLFDQKHITGNRMLAQEIEKISQGLYKCLLPQDWEGALENYIEIRNKDITMVINADLALFNFDGPDLDSGTVVEFIIAKMLDIPCVLLRTDSRNGSHFGEIDWNLMAMGYPRSKMVSHNSYVLYNNGGLQNMHKIIAQSVITAFEEVAHEKSILHSYQELLIVYKHVIKMCGSGLEIMITEQQLSDIIKTKIDKNIYAMDKHYNNFDLNQNNL